VRCRSCHALVASGLQACPHCGTPLVPQVTDYAASQRRAQDLHADFRAGRLDETAYRQALYRLVLRDSQGHYWSFVPEIGWHWKEWLW
jgi:predicted amidophosphoribosyltransferase